VSRRGRLFVKFYPNKKYVLRNAGICSIAKIHRKRYVGTSLYTDVVNFFTAFSFKLSSCNSFRYNGGITNFHYVTCGSYGENISITS